MGRLADRPTARARLKRRMYPIRGYVGPNGTGKSALMVYDALPGLAMGRRCLSTVRLLDFENPRRCDDPQCDYPSHPDHMAAHPLYVPFTSYTQMLDFRDGDILMDEVTGVANSRETAAMPVQVANMLVQLRRRNVSLSWSAPAWGRSDKIIREVTTCVTLLAAAFPRRSPPNADGSPRMWHQRRLFTARSYDPQAMDEFEAHRADDIPVEVIAYYWGPGSTMFKAYDTLDSVTALGWANDAGMCMHCGGKRLIPKCSCETHRAGGAGRPSRTRSDERPHGPSDHLSPAEALLVEFAKP